MYSQLNRFDMSFSVRFINESANISVVQFEKDGHLLFFAVEANGKDPKSFGPSCEVPTLLTDAMNICADVSDLMKMPHLMADAVERVLTRRVQANNDSIASVTYAGIAANLGQIAVVTAGNLRIHLIQNRKLVETTRDHNLIDDPIAGAEVVLAGQLNEPIAESKFFHSILTRQISYTDRGSHHEAEAKEWLVRGNFELLVTSIDAHRFRDPSEYLDEFYAPLRSSGLVNLPVGGLVGLITYEDD